MLNKILRADTYHFKLLGLGRAVSRTVFMGEGRGMGDDHGGTGGHAPNIFSGGHNIRCPPISRGIKKKEMLQHTFSM